MVSRRTATPRRRAARRVRDDAAELALLRPHPQHLSNGEEGDYRDSATNEHSFIANYGKGLPHANNGEVNRPAYRALLRALASGDPASFEAVPVPGPRKLVNPQAGLAFDLEGPDAQAVAVQAGPAGHPITLRPAPRIDGAEAAAEMAELYWMALLRDVRFVDFATNASVQAAAAALDALPAFTGPRAAGTVTPATLFRGFTPGDLAGPFVSQFLLLPFFYSRIQVEQRHLTARPGVDYLIQLANWLAVQQGAMGGANAFLTVPRYIRSMRDLATYVHFDRLYEQYLGVCLILLGMDAPRDLGNPYELRMGQNISTTQMGFTTFGEPQVLTLLAEVATRAQKAVWHQKWFVHRRLRPEEFGGRIHVHLRGAGGSPPGRYPMLDAPLKPLGLVTPPPAPIVVTPNSILDRINDFNKSKGPGATFDTFLLPQAYPEGSPLHPAYGAGHAVVAGACVTILKAWFDESFVLPNPVVPNRQNEPFPGATDGTLLLPAPAGTPPLTVGGELNKLAANIAIGRNMAGVHWRSDYTESVRLGEAVAIGLLEEQKPTYNEPHSFTLTRFDGTTITI